MIKLINITKSYLMEKQEFKALNGISLEIKKGEFLGIVGPSGSGKSTLMNIIGLLDSQDSGEYLLDNINIKKLNDNKLANIRNNKIGFIFQNFNLLNKMTALENVMLPLMYKGVKNNKAKEIALELLEKVGLKGKEKNLPTQLSGGQQQRVAIARALVCNPQIILADEPTGALDSKTGLEIMEILKSLNKKGQTIILITHDINIAKQTNRILKITDGEIAKEGEVI